MPKVDLEEALQYSKSILLNYATSRRVLFTEYSRVFFSATENIKGCLEASSFKEGNAFTVLSGGDHVFNLILHGATKIDTFDINKLTYYAYHLRKAMIEGLSYQDFIDFNYFISFADCRIELVGKLEELKRFMPEDVYEYYSKILEMSFKYWLPFAALFYGKRSNHSDLNNYLASEEDYQKLQRKINDAEVSLHFGDAKDVLDRTGKTYDIILLSNIADYLGNPYVLLDMKQFEAFIKPFSDALNPNGELFNYLYFLNKPCAINFSNITKDDLGLDNIVEFKEPELEGEGFYRIRKMGDEKC